MLRPHLLFVFPDCEDRVDGNSADRDLSGGYAERFKVNACFVHGDEIMLVMMDQPHRVHIEVGDDDYLAARQTLFSLQPRDDLRGKKVSADDQVGLVLAK